MKQYFSDGDRAFDRTTASKIVGLSRPHFNDYLKWLGYFRIRPLTWEHLIEVATMKAFIRSRWGVHSKRQYLTLQRSPQLKKLKFQQLGLDEKQITEELHARWQLL